MIALDTNILVRYLVRDDAIQAELARQLLQEQFSSERPGFVSIAATVELEWVLRSGYSFGRDAIRTAVLELIDTPNLVFEAEGAVRQAIAAGNGDFSDRLIHFIGIAAGCEKTVTFDRAFARLDGVELLRR